MKSKAGETRAGCSMGLDRKTTRLNSSHLVISYAVFCLEKKRALHARTAPRRYMHRLIHGLISSPRLLGELPPLWCTLILPRTGTTPRCSARAVLDLQRLV